MLRAVLGIFLILGVLLNCTNAAMRWLWGGNIVWAEEVMTYGMIFIIMAGTVIVTSADQQLRMDAIALKLPPIFQEVLKLLSHLVLAGVAAYLAVQSWTVVSMMFRMGQVSVAARLPMWIPHSVFLVSFALCALVSLLMAGKVLGFLAQPSNKIVEG